MADVLSGIEGGQLIGLVAVAGAFLCGILGIVLAMCGQWQEHRRAELAAALKQDMLNRGMSAEEIRTVLDAGTKASRPVAYGRRGCEV